MSGNTPRRTLVVGDGPAPIAFAEYLAGHGDEVVVVAESAVDTSAHVIAADLGSQATVQRAVDDAAAQMGGLDRLIHGWLPLESLRQTSIVDTAEPDWVAGCEKPIECAWHVARATVGHLREGKTPVAVFTIPMLALSGGADYTMLAAAAEAIRVLAKSCAQQWGPHGIRVNTIATAPHHWIGPQAAEPLVNSLGVPAPALGRRGDLTGDIAPLISLLDSDAGHFLTATTLVADGGMWMGG